MKCKRRDREHAGLLRLTLLPAMCLPGLACSQEDIDPTLTEVWEPEPPVVSPGLQAAPPSDAIRLVDDQLSAWARWSEAPDADGSPEPAAWDVEDGVMTVVAGAGGIRTRQNFGSVQLHIEWRAPVMAGSGQQKGNSGVFLQERYEVQILDSFENRTYSNGQAASIYKQHIPLVNAARPPGEWQSYDIIFDAPRFDSTGELLKPAYITVLHNGVLVHNHVEIHGTTVYRGAPSYEAHGDAPLALQDHGDRVSFRNIWIRRL